MDGAARVVQLDGRDLHLLGTVRGLVSEADRVLRALDALQPAWVAFGLAPEDLEGIARVVAGESYEHEYSQADEVYAAYLGQFGEVELPPRELLAAYRWATERRLPTLAIDLPEASYVQVFTQAVSAWQLLRYQRRVRRLAKHPPTVTDAMDFHLWWDHQVTRLAGFARVEQAREAFMAVRLRIDATPRGTGAVLVEAARVEGLVRALRAGPMGNGNPHVS